LNSEVYTAEKTEKKISIIYIVFETCAVFSDRQIARAVVQHLLVNLFLQKKKKTKEEGSFIVKVSSLNISFSFYTPSTINIIVMKKKAENMPISLFRKQILFFFSLDIYTQTLIS
jgi:hypothetical protein